MTYGIVCEDCGDPRDETYGTYDEADEARYARAFCPFCEKRMFGEVVDVDGYDEGDDED